MSTEQREINPDRAGLLSNASVRRSQALTETTDLEPEDNRTRRFGYQPATKYMEMAAVLCGQTTGRVEPGVLTLFESFWHKAQNPSVDAADPSGPAIDKESLPGYHVANLLMQYKDFGFPGELRALRGMSNAEAVDLFFEAHPPLHFAAEQGIMSPCIYDGEDVSPDTGRREVCVTCRRNLVDTLLKSEPTEPVKVLLTELRDSIRIGRAHMASEWAKVLSELNTKPNPGMAPTLGSLKDDHYYFMRQLHERTPEAMEMEKSRQATLDTAKIFKAAIGDQTEAMKAASENAALEEMRAQMAEQERRFDERLAQMTKSAEMPATPATPAETEKAPLAGKKAK